MLLESIQKNNLFNADTVRCLDDCIKDVCTTSDHDIDGKLSNKTHRWDYYDDAAKCIREILDPHLPEGVTINQSHILESIYPFGLHTDVDHSGDTGTPQYTVIIPLDDYKSTTFVFNEYYESSNDFEDFKSEYTGELKLRIPKETVLTLTHLHPKDLMYLSIKETFEWTKGSLFAFDRKYYHCSDNYLKAGETSKRAILLWTVEQ